MREGKLSLPVIQSRIANPWMQAVDIAFLFVALYHGLNGLRNIILDFSVVGPDSQLRDDDYYRTSEFSGRIGESRRLLETPKSRKV